MGGAVLASLLQAPSPKSSLAPQAELFKEILKTSMSNMLDEVASVADDVWDSLKQLDDLQNQIVDEKLFSLISGINNNLTKIPGEVGGLIKADLAESFGEFLVGSGLDIKSLKTSLFDFALQLNEIKLQVVDTGVTVTLEQTSNLEKLHESTKAEAIEAVKESLVSKKTVVESLISSLFDLTVQLDDAKRNKVSLNVSSGLDPFMEKIRALTDLVDGIVQGESLDLLTSTINTKLRAESGLVDISVVEQLVQAANNHGGKLGEIETLEKEVEAFTNQTFAELLKVHKHQEDLHQHP